eukprot:3271228-Amphidinium_carterae.1
MQKNPSSRRIVSGNNWRQVSGCWIKRVDLHLLHEDLPHSLQWTKDENGDWIEVPVPKRPSHPQPPSTTSQKIDMG